MFFCNSRRAVVGDGNKREEAPLGGVFFSLGHCPYRHRRREYFPRTQHWLTRPRPIPGLAGPFLCVSQRTGLNAALFERMLVPVRNRESGLSPGGPMLETVALCLFWWVAANVVIVGMWTAYCYWPCKRDTDVVTHVGFRRRPVTGV